MEENKREPLLLIQRLAYLAVERDSLPLLEAVRALSCDDVVAYFREHMFRQTLVRNELRERYQKATLLRDNLRSFREDYVDVEKYTKAMLQRLNKTLDEAFKTFSKEYEQSNIRVNFKKGDGRETFATHLRQYGPEDYTAYLRDFYPSCLPDAITSEAKERAQKINRLTTPSALEALLHMTQEEIYQCRREQPAVEADESLGFVSENYRQDRYPALKARQIAQKASAVKAVLTGPDAKSVLEILDCKLDDAEALLMAHAVSLFIPLELECQSSLFEFAQSRPVTSRRVLLFMLTQHSTLAEHYLTEAHQAVHQEALGCWLSNNNFSTRSDFLDTSTFDAALYYGKAYIVWGNPVDKTAHRALYLQLLLSEKQALLQKILHAHHQDERIRDLFQTHQLNPEVEEVLFEDKLLMAYVLGCDPQVLFYFTHADLNERLLDRKMMLRVLREPNLSDDFKQNAMLEYLRSYGVVDRHVALCPIILSLHAPSVLQKAAIELGKCLVIQRREQPNATTFTLCFFNEATQSYEEQPVVLAQETMALLKVATSGELRNALLRNALFKFCASKGGDARLPLKSELAERMCFYLKKMCCDAFDHCQPVSPDVKKYLARLEASTRKGKEKEKKKAKEADIIECVRQLWTLKKELKAQTNLLPDNLRDQLDTALMAYDGMASFEALEKALDEAKLNVPRSPVSASTPDDDGGPPPAVELSAIEQQKLLLESYIACLRYLYLNLFEGSQPQKHQLAENRLDGYMRNMPQNVSQQLIALLRKPVFFTHGTQGVIGHAHAPLRDILLAANINVPEPSQRPSLRVSGLDPAYVVTRTQHTITEYFASFQGRQKEYQAALETVEYLLQKKDQLEMLSNAWYAFFVLLAGKRLQWCQAELGAAERRAETLEENYSEEERLPPGMTQDCLKALFKIKTELSNVRDNAQFYASACSTLMRKYIKEVTTFLELTGDQSEAVYKVSSCVDILAHRTAEGSSAELQLKRLNRCYEILCKKVDNILTYTPSTQHRLMDFTRNAPRIQSKLKAGGSDPDIDRARTSLLKLTGPNEEKRASPPLWQQHAVTLINYYCEQLNLLESLEDHAIFADYLSAMVFVYTCKVGHTDDLDDLLSWLDTGLIQGRRYADLDNNGPELQLGIGGKVTCLDLMRLSGHKICATEPGGPKRVIRYAMQAEHLALVRQDTLGCKMVVTPAGLKKFVDAMQDAKARDALYDRENQPYWLDKQTVALYKHQKLQYELLPLVFQPNTDNEHNADQADGGEKESAEKSALRRRLARGEQETQQAKTQAEQATQRAEQAEKRTVELQVQLKQQAEEQAKQAETQAKQQTEEAEKRTANLQTQLKQQAEEQAKQAEAQAKQQTEEAEKRTANLQTQLTQQAAQAQQQIAQQAAQIQWLMEQMPQRPPSALVSPVSPAVLPVIPPLAAPSTLAPTAVLFPPADNPAPVEPNMMPRELDESKSLTPSNSTQTLE